MDRDAIMRGACEAVTIEHHVSASTKDPLAIVTALMTCSGAQDEKARKTRHALQRMARPASRYRPKSV
jgi:hypothetical protein